MWEFQAFIKNIYNDDMRVVFKKYDKEKYTWLDAWVRCINDAINGLNSGEVVYSIVSNNEIVRRGNE